MGEVIQQRQKNWTRFLVVLLATWAMATSNAEAAFPTVVATQSTSETTCNCAPTITLPSGIAAGDLVIAFLAQDDNATATWPSPWVELVDQNGAGTPSLHIAYLIASGGETTVSPTMSSAERSQHLSIRISAASWHGTTPPEKNLSGVAADVGDSANPNWGSLTPSWGAEDTLWITAFGIDSPDLRFPVTGWPTNYGDNNLSNGDLDLSTAGVALATRELNAATEDPGVFTTTDADDWVASTIAVRPASVVTYQRGDGKGSDSEVDDSLLDAGLPTTNYGTDTSINVDGSPVAHAVVKFPNIFGPGANQIPRGSSITSATLEVNIPSDTGSDADVYQLIEAWDESQVTWDDRLTGQAWTNAGADGTGSHKPTADGTLPTGSTGWASVDVTTSVQNWSNCEINEGWVFLPTGTSGWTFESSEAVTQANRPKLTVSYGSVSTITTLGDGTDPGFSTIAPGAGATEVDAFTLQIDCGEDDTVTEATVTLAAGTSGGISLVEITSDDGLTVYGSASNPASDTVSISGMSIPVTTTSTQFKVRVTPKSHANMPAPAGSEYSVTATITSFTSDYSDGVPNLAIGRLPVRTVAEADAAIAKILAYEADPGGAWQQQALMVADENDAQIDFEGINSTLKTLIPDEWTVQQIQRSQSGGCHQC